MKNAKLFKLFPLCSECRWIQLGSCFLYRVLFYSNLSRFWISAKFKRIWSFALFESTAHSDGLFSWPYSKFRSSTELVPKSEHSNASLWFLNEDRLLKQFQLFYQTVTVIQSLLYSHCVHCIHCVLLVKMYKKKISRSSGRFRWLPNREASLIEHPHCDRKTCVPTLLYSI